MSNELVTPDNDWTVEKLEEALAICEGIAKEWGISIYPNQLEIVSYQQMLSCYVTVGMPVMYHHWSFGKEYIAQEKDYAKGHSGLAYELVINSDPCIAYLMEENTMTMQSLVIAHACVGHNSFFKNNYLFKQWTNPKGIVDYLVFAKKYIAECEEKYGPEEVERVLDVCHALQNHGVNKYRHPEEMSSESRALLKEEQDRLIDSSYDHVQTTTAPKARHKQHFEDDESDGVMYYDEENLLYFIEKHATWLPEWEIEIIRIVRKIAQYFYPQSQTKVMNEGWASFIHYTMMGELYDRGHISEGMYLEFLASHTSVVSQRPFDNEYYRGINPYALGFAMFSDIRRICEAPTEEDRECFPDLCDTNWLESCMFAMENFKDDSFIEQYLSPKVIRDLKLINVSDEAYCPTYEITEIHNKKYYETIRRKLADGYNRDMQVPDIQVHLIRWNDDRALHLVYTIDDSGVVLNQEDATEVVHLLEEFWRFPVYLSEVLVRENGQVVVHKVYASDGDEFDFEQWFGE